MKEISDLKEVLLEYVKPGELGEPLESSWVRCVACGHRCKIGPGKQGICKVRFNHNGRLFVPWGYVAGLNADPIEKKPLFHVYPGSIALSFGMLGCDFHCDFCQNWVSSQVLRDPEAIASIQPIEPQEIINAALRYGARIVTSTYNEPLITAEWSKEILVLAKKAGLVTSYVSNGNASENVIDYLVSILDIWKIDLKAFSQSTYSKLGGVLENVLRTIKEVHSRGIWTEIVTLVVPEMNDSDDELRKIANFIASVSPDIPWHVTGYYDSYRSLGRGSTSVKKLEIAAEIGKSAGLRFVYAGNRPGQTRNLENTYCPNCKSLLIERLGFSIRKNLIKDKKCPICKAVIPGLWN